MITRSIEKREYLRASVQKAEIAEIKGNRIVLNTISTAKTKHQISSGDSSMFEQGKLAMQGKTVVGTLCIDIRADDVIRVRYAEGSKVPENDTPMVVGSFEGPVVCNIENINNTEGKSSYVLITTKKIKVEVILEPYSLVITDLKKGNRISIGGGEKNYFMNWDSVNTGICYDLNSETAIAVENFTLAHNECIYGFGEKFIRLNKVGQTIDLFMEDGLGVTTPRSYKNIPFYVSTNGYGVYFNHSSPMTFWVGSMSATDVQAAIQDDFLDYYIFTGSIKEVLSNYTTLTGKGVLPPKWTFGYWQSKITYSSAEETLDIIEKFRENNIPCDIIHLDTHWYKTDWFCDLEFDNERFPDVPGYTRKLKELGVNLSVWQLPYIPEGSKLFDDLKAVDGFVKNKDGGIYDLGFCFVQGFKGIVGVVDYTNPKAVKVHQDAFRRLFRLGVKVIKTDFGEAAPMDGVYYDGTPGYKMHNLYPLLYNKALFEVTKEETGDGVVWARSAWAGNQRYPVHWGGDNSPNYNNLIPQLEGGLSFGLSGFQFWSQDIGGFLGNTYDELLTRWMQIGVFLSHTRIHGMGVRELHRFDKETIRICRDYLHLRYRLMPYIYGSATKCVEESLPMARALVIEYQDDPNVWNISDQYLFGDSLMVAPIFDETNRRSVYLPKGIWTDWWTGERIQGYKWIEVEADLDTMPLYIKEGAIIPMGPVMNYVDEIKTEKLDLLVSLFESEGSSSFEIPVNDSIVPLENTIAMFDEILKFRGEGCTL
jgi:alpha-D-xyloside xylohydrolase